MSFRPKIIKLLIRGISALILLFILVGFFRIQQAELGGVALTGYVVGCVVLVLLLQRLSDKFLVKDSDEEKWTQFPRDRLTEDTKRRWWLTALFLLGMLCVFLSYMALMFHAMIIAMTSGGSIASLFIALVPIAMLWLVGLGLVVLSRRKCRLCGHRMTYRHISENDSVREEEDWLVCFRCQIRAVAPPWESERGD